MGRRFVERRHHQRVEIVPAAAANKPLSPAIKVVESAERHQAYRPTFRRLRIDVVKVPEAGRIFEVAEQRQTCRHCGSEFARAPVLRAMDVCTDNLNTGVMKSAQNGA